MALLPTGPAPAVIRSGSRNPAIGTRARPLAGTYTAAPQTVSPSAATPSSTSTAAAAASTDGAKRQRSIAGWLGELSAAVGKPLELGEEERTIFKDIDGKLGRITVAIESQGRARAAAILTLAYGAQGHVSQALEGQWFNPQFSTLTAVAATPAEEFADRLLAARDANPGLRVSGLVAAATRGDALFMHKAAELALAAIPAKKPNQPKKTSIP